MKNTKCPFCRAHTKNIKLLLLHYYNYHPSQFKRLVPATKRVIKVKVA